MNKKSFVIFSILVFVFALNLQANGLQTENSTQERVKNQKSVFQETPRPVVKTYQLKHIKPEELINAAKLYIIDATVYKNTVSVEILTSNVRKFEELLKKIDVEKKSILFKVYTILARRELGEKEEQKEIEDKGLELVLSELKSLWNFQSYKIDNPSFVTVKEESGSNFFRLVSELYLFGLRIMHVNLNSEKPGERNISIGQIQLQQPVRNENEIILIDSKNITVKENGYLVVGVSGINWARRGDALILVISAEIKD